MGEKSPETVVREYGNLLMKFPYVNGIGVGEYPDGKPFIKVFVRMITPDVKRIPKELEGYNVEVEEIGEVYPQA